MRRWLLALPSLVLLAAPPAGAQEVSEGAFTVQNFRPALGPRNWLTVEGARVEGRLFYSVGMFFNYQRDPFVIYQARCRNPEPGGACPGDDYILENPTSIVENQIVGDVMVTLSFLDRLQVGLDLPVTFMTGNEVNTATGQSAGSLTAVGLSDPRFQGKYRFIGNSQGIALAGSLDVTVPFANLIGQTDGDTLPVDADGDGRQDASTGPNGNLGSDIPQFVPKVILDFRKNRWEVGANVGANIRYSTARLMSSEVGTQLLWGLAGGYQIDTRYRVIAEVFGVATPTFELDENPLETDAAFQATFADVTMTVGAGTGLVPGVGSPVARAFLGAIYSPQRGDRDHDGIEDKEDTCADDPEDEDGFLDSDGCPEEDNDADGFLDGRDRCANEAEDKDEFEDEDGCPDTDDDHDGIPDGYDSCRREPEDMDGDRDDDGCPDNDTDGDGLPDPNDRCVNDPEDTDGYSDEDGCPEEDNDGDGVPDESDECGDEPEDRDGFEDENGCPDRDNDGDAVPDVDDLCPDEPGRPQFRGCATAAEMRRRAGQAPEEAPRVEIVGEQIVIPRAVEFANNRDTILERSFPILQAVQAVLASHPEIRKLRIEGHTDDRGNDRRNMELSGRRAASVKVWLVEHGIAADRLEAEGFGETRPIAPNRQRQGRQQNRRVEFHIVDPNAPAPAAAPTP